MVFADCIWNRCLGLSSLSRMSDPNHWTSGSSWIPSEIELSHSYRRNADGALEELDFIPILSQKT